MGNSIDIRPPLSPTHMVMGAGKMGGALLAGWLKEEVIQAKDLLILDPRPGEAAQLAMKGGASYLKSASADLSDLSLDAVKVILLAIKPQMFMTLGVELARIIPKNALVVSIMAGTSLERLSSIFGSNPIIRAMPNTPSAIGAGITAFINGPSVSSAQSQHAKSLLEAGGSVYEVASESMIDIVTAVSGSGPAYVFHMVEALEAAAIQAGMPKSLAPHFARQTIVGAGALLDSSNASATDLRVAVTSPNGTTQAALEVLMAKPGLRSLMRDTVAAALKRAKDLALE